MCPALPASGRRPHYYEASAPPTAISRRRTCPPPGWRPGSEGDRDGSHVHHATDRQGGAQLYPGSIATTTPQTFTVASPPPELSGFGVDPTPARRPCTAYRPRSARLEPARRYGALTLVPLVHLLVSLAGPAPSGSTGTSRLCQGCFPPSPASPGSGCPQLHPAAATASEDGLSPPLGQPAPRGAQLPREESCRGAENLHILPQPPILGLKPLDLSQLLAGDPLPLTGVDLSLATPPPQGFPTDPEPSPDGLTRLGH